MRGERERVLDMLEAIARIEKYAQHGRRDFEADELIQTYFVHHLQVLGEAAFKLSPDFRDLYHEIPWAKILGMRHILVHDYFRIDFDVVWSTVENDLPDLKRELQATLEDIEGSV